MTGGIGAGKTTLSRLLQAKGYPVYNSDIRAKELMNTSSFLKEEITKLLGSESYSSEDRLNRTYVADRIFRDHSLRNELNAIVHPQVAQDYKLWVASQKDFSITFKESAILFESGIYKQLDGTILVVAPIELRCQRIMQRDGISFDQAMGRIGSQWGDEDKLLLADYTVFADDRISLILQAEDLVVRLQQRLKTLHT